MWLRDLIDYFIIKTSGCFDPAYYLLNYRDCRLADVDPLWHFVRYGWKEGRNPSADFDTEYYLKTNPDVQQAGINPLVHYIRYGRREGRWPRASSNLLLVLQRSHPRRRAGQLQRLIYHLGVKVYWAIPPKYRQDVLHWCYSHLGFLFTGTPDYEAWRGRHYWAEPFSHSYNLVDLQTVKPAKEAKGDIAIHLHVFYPDLAEELAGYLKNMPFDYDLYVSVPDKHALEKCHQAFRNLPLLRKIEVRQVPNRGRDVAPLFCAFGEELSRYDYIAHLHTKKSLYNRGTTEGWRTYLYRALLGNPEQIRRIFALMQEQNPYGIVYPQNYVLLPYWANTWLANRELGRMGAARLGIGEIPRGYFDYPVGSMFWARSDALAPLFKAGITWDDFPEEAGQTDGTLAHTIERLFVLCSVSRNMPAAIIRDEQHPSWSPWRFDHYVTRPYTSLVGALDSPRIKLIAFDIFDTLFCRPLLDPETVKGIIARRLGGDLGTLYWRCRHMAEQQARYEKKRDVNLNEIYGQFGQLADLSEGDLVNLQRLEEDVEELLLEPRQEALQLYQEALATGKPVVLITDMFLPRERLEVILRKHGITGWKQLFVSGEIGLRKDDGKLYEYVLTKYGLKPAEFLMIGDDERSDVQIPCDMGASFIHLMRPIELARGIPRFAPILTAHEKSKDIDAELTLGLVIRKNFSQIQFPSFDPTSLLPVVTPYNIGYGLVGPLLVSFAQWLIQQARVDGIDRLYFLSREGRLIKEIYDIWIDGLLDAPSSEYLIISRRAAGVAAIYTFDDILSVAKMVYFPNTVENFLYTRYGLVLDEHRWSEIERMTGWGRWSQMSISKEGRVDHLVPLLKSVEQDILEKVAQERPALLRYLAEKGLDHDNRQAVVDVGYGGSIQGYLNRMLSRKVHGYYLMTDDRASRVAKTYGVILRGCFCENAVQSPNAPAIYRYSFSVEKLLSASEPQVEYYEVGVTGQLRACYRETIPEVARKELSPMLEEIRKGALDYAMDARRIRQEVLPDFRPSLWTAQMLMENFLEQTSLQEAELLRRIMLDDHYCGRGLVA